MSVYSFCDQNGKKKPNQDALSISFHDSTTKQESIETEEPVIRYLAVFDGHGSNYDLDIGKLSSSFVKQYFEKEISKHWIKINKMPEKTMTQLFHLCNDALFSEMKKYVEKRGYKTRVRQIVGYDGQTHQHIEFQKHYFGQTKWFDFGGGTTATFMIFLENSDVLFCNVGDSEAIVFHTDNKFSIATTNHSPDNQDEFERIFKKCEKIELMGKCCYDSINNNESEIPIYKIIHNEGNQEIQKNNYSKREISQHGFYLKNVDSELATSFAFGRNRLSLTRSFGDFIFAQFISDPSFSRFKLSNIKHVLLGSDGVWDNWKKKELAPFFNQVEKKQSNSNNIGQQLFQNFAQMTHQKATRNFGRDKDDISLILFYNKLFTVNEDEIEEEEVEGAETEVKEKKEVEEKEEE